MSVEESSVVDVIGIERDSGKVILTVSDHLDWSRQDEHEQKLQDKLNTYLRFIESGELLESYPAAKGRDPVIEVVTRVEPSPGGLQFLQRVAEIVQGAGIEFRTRVLGE